MICRVLHGLGIVLDQEYIYIIRYDNRYMNKTKRNLVIVGLLGTTLDMGKHPDRWQNWRPTVSLCRQPDLIVGRLELLHGKRDSSLAKIVRNDIRTVSPETEV